MMKRAKQKQPTLRELSGGAIPQHELLAVVEDFKTGPDRSAAIVMSAWVERTLEQLVISALPNANEKLIEKLLSGEGPLSSFYCKNLLGFGLGLYSQNTLDDLEVIRKIRNAFAHSARPITFDNNQVSRETAKLKVDDEWMKSAAAITQAKSRAKYTAACLRFVVSFPIVSITRRFAKIKPVMDALKKIGKLAPTPEQEASINKAIATERALKL
jgi:DNA-binding MltR family transcriptional regulator